MIIMLRFTATNLGEFGRRTNTRISLIKACFILHRYKHSTAKPLNYSFSHMCIDLAIALNRSDRLGGFKFLPLCVSES